MLHRSQQQNAQRSSASRSGSLTSPAQTHLHRPKPPASKLSNVEFGSDLDHAVDLTTPPPAVSGMGAGTDTFTDNEEKDVLLVQDMTLDEEKISTNDPVPQPSNSVRACAPLPLPPVHETSGIDDHVSACADSRRQKLSNDAGRRPQGERPPKLATTLPDGLVADYIPWTGNSVEDVLNENVVRSGYADKPPGSNQSESHTARPSLWPNLKQKTGLPILSALLVQVMEKRQASGRCNAPSTFKPPPRVTLTDAKREAWLRDLAASDVPLRRLSRTIPHGVRGKALLDQCLGKKVPISRALWLAKCVGANELRAFRRKGVSGAAALIGENKWVREWTLLVEQFLESIVASCGQDDWRTKMNYSVRLVTAFFAENLLDTDHYLDWLLSAFRASSTDRIPIWVVLVQILWKSLVGQQRRGMALADALLAQLYSIDTDATKKVNSALLDRLRRLVTNLSSFHGGCMIGLQPWTKHRMILDNILRDSSISDASRLSLRATISRNDRLYERTDPLRIQLLSPKARLVALLDSIPLELSLVDVVSECHQITTDFRVLVRTLLEWACSIHGTGPRRLLLVTRILRYCKDNEWDIETAVLVSLSALADADRFSPSALEFVISRLVQSNHFGYGRYLTWLISNGGLSDRTSTNAGLLTAVPETILSPRLADLRQTILSRLSLVLPDESVVVGIVVEYARQLREQDEGLPMKDMFSGIFSQLETLSHAARITLCSRLQATAPSTADLLHFRTFSFERAIYEQLQDFESLHILVQRALASQYVDVIASAADTVNMNADVFGAMGVLNDLVMNLCNRQRSLRSRVPLDRTLLLSVTRLVERCQMQGSNFKSLAIDLALCEQQVSTAACSPASDNVVLANAGVINSDADIDRILVSGNMMDEQLMARLFSATVERCVKQISTQTTDLVTPSRWFSQLRAFDRAHFDRLSQNLLTKLAGNAGLEQIRILLTALVGSNCMEISVALQAWDRRVDAISSTNEAAAARLSLAALQVFLPRSNSADSCLSIEGYRFKLAQSYICRERASSMQRFLKQALSGSADLTNLARFVPFQDLLRVYAVKHLPDLMETLSVGPNMAVKSQNVRVVMQNLLDLPTNQLDGADDDLSSIMKLVDEYSLPLCKAALKCLLPDNAPCLGSSQSSSSITTAFKEIIELGNPLWAQLISAIPTDAVDELHKWGLELTLHSLTQLVSTIQTENLPESDIMSSRMSVTALTAQYISFRDTCDYSSLIEGFAAFNDILEQVDMNQEDRIRGVCTWLDVSIRMIATIIITASTQAELSGLQQRGRLLCVCCQLLSNTQLQAQRFLSTDLFDMSCLLASALNPDQLASVARLLPPAKRLDARVRFILGVQRPASSWLVLASRVPTTNATSSPTILQGAFQTTSRTSQPPTPVQRSSSQTAALGGGLQSPGSSQPRTPTISTPQNRTGGGLAHELKYGPFAMRPWEMMPDPTTSAGLNDASLSLTMFAARRGI